MRFIREWYMVILPLLFAALMAWLLFQPRSTTMSVPVEFCNAQYTGRTKAEDVPLQSCAAYDKNMICTAPITTWATETRNETRVVCDFIEWR
jgi:hypothetical protein